MLPAVIHLAGIAVVDWFSVTVLPDNYGYPNSDNVCVVIIFTAPKKVYISSSNQTI